MSIRAVFFDFDGTLADTAPDMVLALNRWLAARGKPAADMAATRNLCSGGARALLSAHGWDGEEYDSAARDYLQCYADTGYRQTALFAGIADVLAVCGARGLAWGVVTNKPRKYYAPIVERLRLPPPDVAICGDDLSEAKPSPLPLQTAAKRCGLPPSACLYVGDDGRDAQAAQAAGMPFVAVSWGYWQSAQWTDSPPLSAAAIVSSPAVLATLLAIPAVCGF